MTIHKKTLIAGATGQIGSSVGNYLAQTGGWNPLGLARNPGAHSAYPMIAIDLTNPEDCINKLSGLTDITHILYAARFDHYGGELESKDTNVEMLKDRFGVSWQIVPSVLSELMSDAEKAPRVVQAFLKMKKFDIETLLNA